MRVYVNAASFAKFTWQDSEYSVGFYNHAVIEVNSKLELLEFIMSLNEQLGDIIICEPRSTDYDVKLTVYNGYLE